MKNLMVNTAKTLFVTFTAKDMKSSLTLKNALNYVADLSKNEEGIIRYEVFMSDNNPLDYYVLETWSSERTLENHLNQFHVRNFVTECQLLLASPFSIVPLAIPFKPEWLKPLITNSISLN